MQKTFSDLNLNTPLLNAINDLSFLHPTPIQIQCFPIIMAGKDIIGIAQTGSGKTFAYLLPILRNLKYSEKKSPRILIMVPTRELVLQVVGEIEKATKYLSVRSIGVHGGKNIKRDQEAVFKGCDIIVGTPGRLMDLYMSGILRFKEIKKLVVDEMDEMLNLGYRGQVNSIFDLMPEKKQTMMFSATLSPKVNEIIDSYIFMAERIIIDSHGSTTEKIDQIAYHVPNYNTKINLLKFLLDKKEEFEKTIIFSSNKRLADRIFNDISESYPNEISIIHSNKSQNFRTNAIKNFENKLKRILIATDIASRGIDFLNVSHVINFDTPEAPGDYIHRIGRTGRYDKQGTSITFVNDVEQEYQMSIEKLTKKTMRVESLPKTLEISNIFSDDEKPTLYDKDYLINNTLKNSQGAFHEKAEKNKKVNLGGPGKKRQRTKKTKNRSKRRG